MNIQLRDYQKAASDKAVAFFNDKKAKSGQTEIWKDIAGYEGLYQVSNLGRIRSLTRKVSVVGKKNGRVFKGKIKKDVREKKNGYLVVSLFRKGNSKRFFIHRLVATAFIPNSNDLPQVNHKDEDKTNNKVSNLEWCDAKYNTNYGSCIEKRIAPQCKRVSQYTISGAYVQSFASMADVERTFGFNHSAICACCKDFTKTAYGYKWKYAE